MGNGLARMGGDAGLELLEVVSHCVVLLPRGDPPHVLDLEPEPAARQVGAEDVEDWCSREHGQIGPDGEESEVAAQQPARPGVRARPGDVAADVKAQPGLHRRAGAGDDLDRRGRIERPAEEESGLGMDVAGGVEEAGQDAGDVPRPLHEGPHRQARAQEPVQAGDVSPKVAPHQDRACARTQGSPQPILALDLEPAERQRIGRDVEHMVASQRAAQVGCQLRPQGAGRLVKLQGVAGARERLDKLSAPSRPDDRRELP